MTSRQPHEPRVGIFWLRNGKLITDFTPVSEAIAIRLGLGHAAGHIEYWTALQERGVISIEVEYEEPPRGRVGYPRPYAYRYGGWRGREWRRDHDWRR